MQDYHWDEVLRGEDCTVMSMSSQFLLASNKSSLCLTQILMLRFESLTSSVFCRDEEQLAGVLFIITFHVGGEDC